MGTQIYPFVLLFYFGLVFEASLSWTIKAVLIAMFYGVSYAFKRWENLFFFNIYVKLRNIKWLRKSYHVMVPFYKE